MKSIKIEDVSKSYNGDIILDNINLTIDKGQFFVLLGPSGSGKTTLLRLIAGFINADSGSIYLGKEDITNTPINKRRINTVFQDYALFPNLNVFENIAYSMTIKGLPKDAIEHKVTRIIKAVHLEKQKYKDINQLSGGQKQRVAIARAVVNEPEVLLLDEPLAALDIKLREAVLLELIDLHDTLKTTFIYVTHDQFEALAVADQIAIMNNKGEIEQIGTPKDIYEFPKSSFVAKFIGSTNILNGKLEFKENSEHEAYIDIPKLGTFNVYVLDKKDWMTQDKNIIMSLRPEKIFITKVPVEGFSNMLTGTIDHILYHGRSTQYNVKLKNNKIMQVFEQNNEHFPQEVIDYDDKVYLYWQKESGVILED